MPLRADLLEPVAGDSPAGASLRYEPVYDQIKQARIEEADVPQGLWQHERRTADYALVIKLAGEMLAKRSKDLQLAAWLTEAHLRREGFAGLAESLTLLRELIERYWDGLFPEIDEGDLEFRAAPLEWVGQYLDGAVRGTPLTRGGYDLSAYRESRLVGYEKDTEGDYDKQEARKQALAEGKLSAEKFDEDFTATPKAWYKKLMADVEASRAALGTLDSACKARFADAAPSFSKLRTALDDVRLAGSQLLGRKLELEPDPPEVVAAETAAAAAGEGAAGAEGAPGGGGLSPVPTSRDDALARIAAAARFLRAAAPMDPAPYLMLRGLRWGELRAGAGLDPKLLTAPPTEVRSRLKGYLLDAQWPQLLETGEEVMAQAYGRGWLDLQRYVLTACEGLGSGFDAVAAAISGALRTLLRDLPDLPGSTMMDDTPTANAETRQWLRDRGLLGGAEEELEEEAAPAAGRKRAGRDAYDRALDRVRAGEPQRAIELLLREAEQEKSERARFLRRSQAARVMVEAGHDPVALPILRELLQQIEQHTLEGWEAGDTVAQPLGLLYRCLARVEPDSGEKDELYLRICRLDPMQAMQLKSNGALDVSAS